LDELYDVIVIGGGPAGLVAAQYAARANLKALVLDKSPSAGALAFASKIENYPGLEPISGKELLDLFRKQAVGFGAEYKEAQVIGVNISGNVKEVFTMEKNYSAKAVIIATGSMGRKPSIKGEGEFLGKGVSYCAICDAPFFKNKKVCVIGSSEEAAKEAGVLAKFASEVFLISPLQKLSVPADYPAITQNNVKVLLGMNVTVIEGTETVKRIKMLDHEKKESTLELSGVFVYLHGSRPVVDFLTGAIELSENECVGTNRMMETSIPGVFAAGDVTCTEVRQVVLAAANGCTAALSAEKYIQHRKRRKYDWGGH
jgi:thioredoxin reductase (NADPH)